MIPQTTNSFRLETSALHFSYADCTERGNFVKALRFAPTADAAPTSGGLDKAPFYAPVFASSYGKNEEKKLGGARATTKPKPCVLRHCRKTYTRQTMRRPSEIEQTFALLHDLIETRHQICDEIRQGLATMRANVQQSRELRRISEKNRQIRKPPQPAKPPATQAPTGITAPGASRSRNENEKSA